jgi:hypothetical protein
MDDWVDVAAGQLGLVTRRQMLETGVTRGELDGMCRSGRIRRVERGLYVVAGSPSSREREALARVLLAGEGAAASHWSAAWLWDMPNAPWMPVEISVPDRRNPRRPIGRPHRVTLPTSHVTRLRDVPVTTYERTLCDLAARWSKHQLGRALDAGLRRAVASLTALHRTMTALESGPGRRPAVIYALLDERTGKSVGDSGAEVRLRRLLESAGLPSPVMQHRIDANGREYVIDLAYPAAGVLIEFDGFVPHSTRTSFVKDRRKLSDLVTAGFRPLVFSDGVSDAEVVHQVCMALGVSSGPHLAALRARAA